MSISNSKYFSEGDTPGPPLKEGGEGKGGEGREGEGRYGREGRK